MRVYQANNFEIDPQELDGESIAEQCSELNCNAIIVDAGGGISTFYHSDIPYLTPNPYLDPGHDFLAEMTKACHGRGIRVFARNDYGHMSGKVADEHPEWAVRGPENKIWWQEEEIVATCPSGGMFRDVAVKAFDEQISRYGVDGIYINALGNNCYCDRCLAIFKKRTGYDFPEEENPDDPACRAWIEFRYWLADDLARFHYEGVKKISPETLYFIDAAGIQQHGWIRGKAQDLKTHAKYQDIASTEAFNDMASKNYPRQLAPIVARYVRRVGDRLGKPGAVFVSSFPGHSWPRSAQPEEQFSAYLASVYFNGVSAVTPWYGHCAREDKRAVPAASDVFGFVDKNAETLRGASPSAPVAVVYSRVSADYYGKDDPNGRYMHGFYAACMALLREHIPFTVIPDTDIEEGIPEEISTLVLANFACMSDTAATAIDVFVENGKSVLATFETGMYDEQGRKRPGFACGCFGAGFENLDESGFCGWDRGGTHSYISISSSGHPVFAGFENSSIIPHKGPFLNVNIRSGAKVLGRLIPASSSQPPEQGWRNTAGDSPMIIENNDGRTIYFTYPIFKQFWEYELPDFRRLAGDSVRSLSPGIPFETDAPGLVEINLLKKEGATLLGLVNHIAGVLRDDRTIAAGPFNIKFKTRRFKKAVALNGSECRLENDRTVHIDRLDRFDLIVLE